MSFRRLAVAMLVALVFAGIPAVSHAQAVRGTILGTITDQTGAAMPGATVVATETRTNVSYDTVTNEAGNYTFPNIFDGIYNIKAELQGFKTVVREAIRLAVNTSIRVDLALSVGELAETVTVTGETPLLQTDRTDTGRVLESIQVAAMPLAFNRNFQGMLATVPGATRPFRPHSEFFNPQDSLSTQVNGQSRLANNVQIEGIDNNHRTGLLTVLIPPAEAIDTVSVTTSNYDAEFGRAAGAVSSVTLKSGTNTLKGSVFWFGNTDAVNAKPASVYFTPTLTKAPTRYNQFGFTIGGPIRKNRFFYFGDYQRTQDRLGSSYRFTVPTAEFRRGDFSAATTKVYDPATGDAAGNNRLPFTNNQIPSNRISSIAQSILSKIPLPNAPGLRENYLVNSYRDKTTDSFDVKINYSIDNSNQVSGRFSYQRPEITQLPADGYGDWGGPLGGGFMATGTNMTYSTAANWTRTFSNTFLMEVRGGTSYYHNEALTTANGQKLAEEVGIKGANVDEWTSGPSTINIANGFSNPVMGYVNSLPWDRWERTWEFATTMTKVWSNHTIKLGGNWRKNSDKLLQTQDNQGPRGGFSFSGQQTGSPADTAANSGQANAFASFLLDLPSGMARDLKVLDDVGSQHWALYTFVHDKWQVSPRVTLDLGLRWEYYDPMTGIAGRGSLSNYDPATNSLLVSGYGDVADDFGIKKDLNNFSPRLGASFRLDDRSVVRGGFGGSTTPFPDNRYAFNYPVKQNNSYQTPNSYSPTPFNMAAGFPAPTYLQVPENGIIVADTTFLKAQSYWHVPTDLQQGTIYSWNAAYQRELAWGLTGEAAYVGNFSNDVLNRFPMNAGVVLGAGPAGQPLNAKYGRTAGVENLAWKGKTRYHALQVKLDRRFRNGWLVTNSYTLGRSWDYHSENGGPGTPADIERSWGLSDFTRRHTYVGSFVWSLPWFKNSDAGVLHWVLGNWQVSGIFTYQTGQVLDVTANAASLNTPGNTQRPNQSGTPTIIGDYGQGNFYFDTSVFSAPAANTFGARTRNAGDLWGPRFTNLDFSVVKQFNVGGSRMGEFRVDMWNLPNTVHMNNPNTSFGDARFGMITGAYGERQIRFSARFMF